MLIDFTYYFHVHNHIYRARFGVRASRSCVVSYLVVFEHHVRCLTHKLTQHVCSCFVCNGTLHVAWLTLVFDADEACFYTSTC